MPTIFFPLEALTQASKRFIVLGANRVDVLLPTFLCFVFDIKIVYKMPPVSYNVGGCTKFASGDETYERVKGGRRRPDYSYKRKANYGQM